MYKITLKDGTIYNFKNIKINKYTVDGKDENDITSIIDIRNIKEISFEVKVQLDNKIEKGIISINSDELNDFIFKFNNRTFSISTQKTNQLNAVRGHRTKLLSLYDDLYYEALATINEVINKFDTLDSFKEKELKEMVDRILYASSNRNKNEKENN